MGIIVNRDKFWQQYKANFGAPTSGTVSGLNFILDKFELEERVKLTSHFSYILSTVYSESGHLVNVGGRRLYERFQPVKETKSAPGTPNWINYQSHYWNSGYYGRSYLQITLIDNYRKASKLLGIDFVTNPDLLLEPEYAYEILVVGMIKGMFRSDKQGQPKTLYRYLRSDLETIAHYTSARDIINGDGAKNGLMMAQNAKKFENMFVSCKEIAPILPIDSPENEDSDSSTPSNPDSGASTTVSVTKDEVKVETNSTPAPQEKLAVVKPEPVNYFKALWTKITGVFAGGTAITYAQQAQTFGLSSDFWEKIIYLALGCGIIVVVVLLFKQYEANKKINQETSDLVKANTTDNNKVDIITSDKVDSYKERGYKVVTRE